MVSPPGPQPGASASSATSARKPTKYTRVGPLNRVLDYRRLPFAASLERAYVARPERTAWLVLTVGMEAMMTVFSWGTGLGFRQWIALAVATLVLAWLCVWIVFLEEEE